MGIKFEITKEPDFRKVAKNLVKVEKPCVEELQDLMECMKVRLSISQHPACMHAFGPQAA